MSAIAALRGYRTQFLYSLHYILSHPSEGYRFRLEGEEDLDVLDLEDNLLFAIQIKNLATPIVLSDLLSKKNTSFLKRFEERYSTSTPMLVSFGSISAELKQWRNSKNTFTKSESNTARKYRLKKEQWQNIKAKTVFIEVQENTVIEEILQKLKQYSSIDPAPTAEILLYWIQFMAEKQISITSQEIFKKIESIALYLSQRIAISEQYGIFIRPLHLIPSENVPLQKLKEEFHQGISARFEHIVADLDIPRPEFIQEIDRVFQLTNVVIIQGASGQGKSTLAYRWVRKNAPSSLIYDLILQNEPILTNKFIQSIIAATKDINASVVFLVHVQPNTVEWIKVVREFSNTPSIRFLVTIREEDWRRAMATGINFLFESIELNLNRTEAETIYNSLNQENQILNYANFTEAWIKMGESVPLLEFIYPITHGNSLKLRLKQQVSALVDEANITGNHAAIEILRMISIADAYGGAIAASKLSNYTSLQFILENFEKEYLIKRTDNNKYITGLHPVRSTILNEILFDEFVTYKSDYALKCLVTVRDQDTYPFLLHCFSQQILLPNNVISSLEKLNDVSWSLYNSTCQGLLWAGVSNYIAENKAVFDESYEKFSDAWLIMLDIYHGDTLDIKSLQENIGVSSDFKQASVILNSRLTPKQNTYKYLASFFKTVPLPQSAPEKLEDWIALGELLFWLKEFHVDLAKITESDFKNGFKLLGAEKLSKLMFGMFYYSKELDEIRLKLIPFFISKLRKEYHIPFTQITDEVTLDYIVNVFNDKQKGTLHDRAIEIIDIIRHAFPDKKRYNTQGHGHRWKSLPTDYDDTHKSILVENLPQQELVNINALNNRLYEYTKHPKDWLTFFKQLDMWECELNSSITQFNDCLLRYNKDPSSFKPFASFFKNISSKTACSIKEPQSILDPLGIYYNAQKKTQHKKDNDYSNQLRPRYEHFFKNLNDLKSAIDNFQSQSMEVIISKAGLANSSKTKNIANTERISLENVFEAIEKSTVFTSQKQKGFEKYINRTEKSLNQNDLVITAFLWKDFLTDSNHSNKTLPNPAIRFSQLRQDMEQRINRDCRFLSKKSGFSIRYVNDERTVNKPIILLDTYHPINSLIQMQEAYSILKEIIGTPEYTSVKQLMLQTHFQNIYFIPLTFGNTINNHWFKIPLHKFRDSSFGELSTHHLIPTVIDSEVIENLKLLSWNEIYPSMDDTLKFSDSFGIVLFLTEHIADLKFFAHVELDEAGTKMVSDHIVKILEESKLSFQIVLDFLADIINKFPFDPEGYKNELEVEYWKTLGEIRNNLFPTEKGDEVDYQVTLNMDIIIGWAEKLKNCSSSFGIFILLLYGKFIDEYRNKEGLAKSNFPEN